MSDAAEPREVLKEADHMREMEVTEMRIVSVSTPSISVIRVVAHVDTKAPAAWQTPNLAIRLALPNPDGGKKASRIYTVRSFDPVTQYIEVDFVRHADPSPAMLWIKGLNPGDTVGVTGPRQHFLPNFEGGKHSVLLADDTAIPAVYSMLEWWPEGKTADIFVDTADGMSFNALPHVAGVRLHRVHEGEAGTRLVEAARPFSQPAKNTIWAACERDEARAIRKLFGEAGFVRDDLRVYGYWKRGATNTEIDEQRLSHYKGLLAVGKTLDDADDLDIAI